MQPEKQNKTHWRREMNNVEKDQQAQAFTRRETARIWGVSEGLVIKLDTAGRIKTIRISRRKLVPRDEVDRVLREGIPARPKMPSKEENQ